MRFGLHCGSDRVVAAAYDRGVLRAHFTVPATNNSLDAAETALQKLAAHTGFDRNSTHVPEITFELSQLLVPDTDSELLLIRISPRRAHATYEPFSLPHLGVHRTAATPRVQHLAGGHDARGHEIVPLGNALELRGGGQRRFVVTAVGSLLSPEHELQLGEQLAERTTHAMIEYSHGFHHTSFAVRERTAYVNLALRERAEVIATSLSVAARQAFPDARLFVATNSSTSVPLTRLALTPVDSVASRPATEAVGAAALAGVSDGPFEYVSDAESSAASVSCELLFGIPTVVPTLSSASYGKLASPASNIRINSGAATAQAPLRFEQASEAGLLTAIGAAQLPRAERLLTLIQVSSEEEMILAQQGAEARAHARLVAIGALPEHIRTVESLVTATSYGNPGIITLRVCAITTEPPAEPPAETPADSRAHPRTGGAK